MKSLDKIAESIHSNCEKCYLDTGAMSLMPEEVWQAVQAFHDKRRKYGPAFAEYWKEADLLRQDIASLIGSSPEEIMFLQNTSMGINLAAQALKLEPGDNVVITNLEFPSNVYPWMNMEARGVEVRMLDITDGVLDEPKLFKICDEKTKALSISWVQSANGMVADLEMCSEFCRNNHMYFVLDAIQGMGVLPLDVRKVHLDLVISGFFKWLLGPDGIAFVYVNKEALPELGVPFTGWAGMKNIFDYSTFKFDLAGEARQYETGNMNFSGIYGARQGVKVVLEHQREITERVQELTGYLREQIRSRKHLTLLSPGKGGAAGITLLGCENAEKVFEELKAKNICVNYRRGLRVSVHFYNTKEDVDRLMEVLDD
ncbi:aminotransferase class V-fold PLP-dependent enzyme [Eubacterium sp. am_0171]|uniref:aminotransferase class V-fold PLP-dependent enzyme n=1 Tax=unclassified Eubacterium (in: firmicutes) TaxID=2624479 RepID=UPI0010211804|nr:MULTISPECIES: aminotransferase class V-fold PLP-dependent enzyme [unclassified Eubacterium (in: firmicutes)]MSC82376.1 aminotransferase class V-fold PLP-dependent enzyme [Eubacterium sp. BIOML-A1]MSD04746.1 aminotransferase class V-fold PLP-dependent enzyme [Eubacterium sp. BIOML-A2]RYT25568.1 aminotransferase class V-fold PLP-dependent enzyme [Eubacterium sp. am_0171]